MRRDLVIYGSGGFGREVLELIKDITYTSNESWHVLGFINDLPESHGSKVNNYPILGGMDWVKRYKLPLSVVIAIGNPIRRKLIHNRLKDYNVEFPNIIHSGVKISNQIKMGYGNIICAGSILTTDILIENFVIINLSCTVGHDVIINSYSTLLPSCNISGNVLLEECVDIGTNTCIIPNVSIGENSIVGAGATVIRNIPSNCTAVGSPAKPIKYHSLV
jgi:sugar O-acyltransferase (sialic acid O-acetyltransferase NeuD family)